MSVGDSFIVMLGKDVSLAEQEAKKAKKRARKEKAEEIALFSLERKPERENFHQENFSQPY